MTTSFNQLLLPSRDACTVCETNTSDEVSIMPRLSSLQLGGALIGTTSLPKFLGVTIDRALFFGPHVAAIFSKASNKCRVLASLTSKRWGWRKDQFLKVSRALHLSVIDNAAQPGNPGWPQLDWTTWNAAKTELSASSPDSSKPSLLRPPG